MQPDIAEPKAVLIKWQWRASSVAVVDHAERRSVTDQGWCEQDLCSVICNAQPGCSY